MGKPNEIKLIGLPDFVEPRPDIGADIQTVAACFKRTEGFTFKATVTPEVLAIMLGAVRIVHCKDCKHAFRRFEGDTLHCPALPGELDEDGLGNCAPVPDDFWCKYGTLKD